MMSNRAQTVAFFQDDLKKEIEKIADDMLFFQPGTDELSKLRVFKQALPIPQREVFETDMSETIEYADDSEEKSVFKLHNKGIFQFFVFPIQNSAFYRFMPAFSFFGVRGFAYLETGHIIIFYLRYGR